MTIFFNFWLWQLKNVIIWIFYQIFPYYEIQRKKSSQDSPTHAASIGIHIIVVSQFFSYLAKIHLYFFLENFKVRLSKKRSVVLFNILLLVIPASLPDEATSKIKKGKRFLKHFFYFFIFGSIFLPNIKRSSQILQKFITFLVYRLHSKTDVARYLIPLKVSIHNI